MHYQTDAEYKGPVALLLEKISNIYKIGLPHNYPLCFHITHLND